MVSALQQAQRASNEIRHPDSTHAALRDAGCTQRSTGIVLTTAALHKDFAIFQDRKITVGAEAYNLFNHPNFGVPSNTQSAFSLRGTGDAVFKDAVGDFADNVAQILTTTGTGRQFQLGGRFTF